MKQLKSSVTESGVPVASVAAAAGPWLPTQVRAALAAARWQSSISTPFHRIQPVSTEFNLLFKKNRGCPVDKQLLGGTGRATTSSARVGAGATTVRRLTLRSATGFSQRENHHHYHHCL